MNTTDIYQVREFYKPYFREIHKICKPFLDQYNLGHFWYSRVYADGSFIDLGLDDAWQLHVLESNYYDLFNSLRFNPGMWPENELRFCSTPNNFSRNISKSSVSIITYKYKIFHIFNLLIRRDHYLENFGFSASIDHINCHELYSREFGILKAFGYYFKKQAHSLIKEVEKKGRINLPINNIKTLSKNTFFRDITQRPSQGWLEHNIKHFPMVTPRGEVLLTSRQRDCLSILSEGKSCKEIAYCLNLSPRTVDAHFLKLKEKTGISARSQLIDTFIQSGL